MNSKKTKTSIFVAVILAVSLSLLSCKSGGDHKNESAPTKATDTRNALKDDTISGEYIVILDSNYQRSLLPKIKLVGREQDNKELKKQLFQDLFSGIHASDSVIVAMTRYSFLARLSPELLQNLRKNKKVHQIVPHILRAYEFSPMVKHTVSSELQWNVQMVWLSSHPNGSYHQAWVVDTGVDPTNTDLNIGLTLSFVSGESPDDAVGHGTFASSIIGAKADGQGSVGVAPNTVINSLKVFGSSNKLDTWGYIQALEYVLNNAKPGDVLNLSLDGSVFDQDEYNAIRDISKNVYVVIAAGNKSKNVDDDGVYPAAINFPNVYTVSSINDQMQFSKFSNFGASVDYAAPGEGVYSSGLGGTVVSGSGTSFSAPHLSGLILLTGGIIHDQGTAMGDPDGIPDKIIKE